MNIDIEKWKGLLISYGFRILVAAVILIVGKWVARKISELVERVLNKSGTDETLSVFAKHITNAVLVLVVVIAAIHQLGIQTTSLIAVIGAAGFAVGMALQGSLAHFAAGVLIIMFKPFKVGDFIEGAGIMGTVKEIQLFTTIVNTPDNKKIIIPNSKLTADNMINYSDVENRRVDMIFGIAYGDDIEKGKETLKKVLKEDSRVLTDPAPQIVVGELGDSSVNILCRPWVKTEDYWDVKFDILEKGKIALEKNGLSIPFPQHDVHVFNTKE
ncbi:mechanosensitive ion channel [bacterium]|nr:mechanosensitive ion channel [bacterium]